MLNFGRVVVGWTGLFGSILLAAKSGFDPVTENLDMSVAYPHMWPAVLFLGILLMGRWFRLWFISLAAIVGVAYLGCSPWHGQVGFEGTAFLIIVGVLGFFATVIFGLAWYNTWMTRRGYVD